MSLHLGSLGLSFEIRDFFSSPDSSYSFDSLSKFRIKMSNSRKKSDSRKIRPRATFVGMPSPLGLNFAQELLELETLVDFKCTMDNIQRLLALYSVSSNSASHRVLRISPGSEIYSLSRENAELSNQKRCAQAFKCPCIYSARTPKV